MSQLANEAVFSGKRGHHPSGLFDRLVLYPITGFCLGDIEWWSKFNLQDTSSKINTLSPILKIL